MTKSILGLWFSVPFGLSLLAGCSAAPTEATAGQSDDPLAVHICPELIIDCPAPAQRTCVTGTNGCPSCSCQAPTCGEFDQAPCAGNVCYQGNYDSALGLCDACGVSSGVIACGGKTGYCAPWLPSTGTTGVPMQPLENVDGVCEACGDIGQDACGSAGAYWCQTGVVQGSQCEPKTHHLRLAVLLCEYADVSGPPLQDGTKTGAVADAAYFTRHFGAGGAGVSDFYNAQSYGNVDFAGSQIFDWHTITDTFASVGSKARPNNGGLTCITEQQAKTDLTGFDGIVAVMNKQTDSGATNVGPYPITLNGTTHYIPLVVTGPGGGFSTSFLAHELGHTQFSLPHSYDQGTTVYGDWFDLMSCFNCAYSSDPNFATTGPNLSAGTRALQGWLTANTTTGRILTYTGTALTTPLAALDHPWVYAPLMVKIPLSSGSFYTLESRDSTDGGIDKGMEAGQEYDPVLLQRVDTDGTVHLIAGGTGGHGGFTAGDSYTDSANNVTVKVLSRDAASTATVSVAPAH